MIEQVKNAKPLIHCITNKVTMNDCANALLAIGGSPIMADDEAEVEDITSICQGLLINIGTLNQATIPSMMKAGKKSQCLTTPCFIRSRWNRRKSITLSDNSTIIKRSSF